MFKISDDEKKCLMDNCYDYFQGKDGRRLFKILANYLVNTSDINKLKDLDDIIIDDVDKFKEYCGFIMKVLIDGAIKQ